MVTREEKQRRKQLATAEMSRRQAAGWKPAGIQEGIRRMEATAEQRIAEPRRAEEQEASRISRILKGFGTARQKAEPAAQKAGATAQATAKGLAATGRGMAAAGRFMKEDLRQTGEDLRAAKSKAAAAGAAVGAGAGWFVRGARRNVQRVGQGAEAVKAVYIANEINLFFIICAVIWVADFMTKFSINIGVRFAVYLLLAYWGNKFFDHEVSAGRMLLMVYLASGALAYIVTWLLPGVKYISLIALGIIFLGCFFYPGIKFGMTNFFLSGLAFVAFFPAIIDIYDIPFANSSNLIVLIASTLMSMSWILYLGIAKTDWGTLGKKPALLRFAAVLILVLLISLFYVPLSDLVYASQIGDQLGGTVETPKVTRYARDSAVRLWEGAKKTPQLVTSLGDYIEQQRNLWIEGVTGVSTDVDDSEFKEWFLSVKDVYPWNEQYSPNEPITIEAEFQGDRKDETVTVPRTTIVNFYCRVVEKEGYGQKVDGKPKDITLLSILGEGDQVNGKRSVICEFPSGLAEAKPIEAYASVGFSTSAELESYFISLSESTVLQGTQKIKQYQNKPLSKAIGMGPVSLKLEYEENYPLIVEPGRQIVLYIVLFDRGGPQGKIMGLQNLVVTPPSGASIASCRLKKGKNTYPITVTNNVLNTADIKYPIEEQAVFKCDLNFEQGISKVKKEITTASVGYTYEVARPTRPNVRATTTSSASGSCTGFTPDKSNVPSQEDINQYEKYKDKILSAAQKNTPSGMDATSFAALITAVMQKESSMATAGLTEAKDGISAITGCDWPCGSKDCCANSASCASDQAQLDCTASRIKRQYESPSGTYAVCSGQQGNERLMCVLGVYNAGDPPNYDYADQVIGFWEKWKNYLCTASVSFSSSECSNMKSPFTAGQSIHSTDSRLVTLPENENLYTFYSERPHVGLPGMICVIQKAAGLYNQRTGNKLSIGDIWAPVGTHVGKSAHYFGNAVDIDVTPNCCSISAGYNQRDAEQMVLAFIEAGSPLILYNDNELVERYKKVQSYPDHEGHLHVYGPR